MRIGRGEAGGAASPKILGDAGSPAAREIWAKPIVKELFMCVCVLLFFSKRDIFYFKLKSAW